jgi:pyruvate kinase
MDSKRQSTAGTLAAVGMGNAKKAAIESSTMLEHMSKRDIDTPVEPYRKTGIICTIGPASQSADCLERLVKAGMDVVRLNFSHGSHEYHRQTIENARLVAKKLDKVLAIALDTKGPEIRTGNFLEEEVFYKPGDNIRVTTDNTYKDKGCKECFWVDYLNMPNVVEKGSMIYVDDGLLGLEVIATDGHENIDCVVVNGAPISNHKGVNLPNVEVDLPALSEKDKRDLRFGIEMGIDMVFASFVRKPEDYVSIRNTLGSEGSHIKIIAKIENHEGVKKFKEILEVVDGVMVARGDLGIEVPTEQVSIAQKMMICNCMMVGKPCIVATQMLESMVHNPRPTRAEASDVANAVMDGADCVMLSGETAKGKYPVEAVATMAKICQQAESAVMDYTTFEEVKRAQLGKLTTAETVCCSAVMASFEINAKLLIVLTNSGKTARLVCKFRPSVPVICVVGANCSHTARQLAITKGAVSFIYDDSNGKKSADERISLGLEFSKKHGKVAAGDSVICVYSDLPGQGFPNLMKVVPV